MTLRIWRLLHVSPPSPTARQRAVAMPVSEGTARAWRGCREVWLSLIFTRVCTNVQCTHAHVYKCMSMCLCKHLPHVCEHPHICVHMHSHIAHVHRCPCTHTAYMQMHICAHTAHMCMLTHSARCIHVCTRVLTMCIHACTHAYMPTHTLCARARTHTWLASEEGQEPALCSRPNSSVSGDLEPDMRQQTLQERAGVREDRTAGAS